MTPRGTFPDSKWKTKGLSSRVLTALVSFSKRKLSSIATYWANPANHKYLYITDRMQECVNAYIGMLNSNHGIKGENLLNILLPMGISFDEIDNTWLNTMNSFGEERGKVAHSTSRALNLIDPMAEINSVVLVLKGIRKIDKKICVLKESI